MRRRKNQATSPDLDAAAAAIDACASIALACHVAPDGDALGSMLALHHLCLAAGKRSVASWPEPFFPSLPLGLNCSAISGRPPAYDGFWRAPPDAAGPRQPHTYHQYASGCRTPAATTGDLASDPP